MSDKNKPANAGESRRRLLKTVAAGGSALGLCSLPGKWTKPTVASVILPAHAQTSGCIGTLANCPNGDLFSTSAYSFGSLSVTQTNLPPGVSYTNGTFDGSYIDQGATNFGPCPSPCEVLDGQKYYRYSIGFSSGSVRAGYTLGVRCGNEPVIRVVDRLNGTYSTNNGGLVTYTGSRTFSVDACKYLTGTGTATMTVVPFNRSRRFGS